MNMLCVFFATFSFYAVSIVEVYTF